MNAMVERVARALWARCGVDPDPEAWRAWEAAARDAIEEMREPTNAMVIEGNCTLDGDTEIAEIWQAMIDEALA